MMTAKKKGAVGSFEVWHTGASMYEVRNAGGWVLSRATSLNEAFRKAERWNAGMKTGELA